MGALRCGGARPASAQGGSQVARGDPGQRRPGCAHSQASGRTAAITSWWKTPSAQGFDYRYFVLTGEGGEVRAIQPFFLLDQDLLAGAGPRIARLAETIRRIWPRFLLMRTLMVGCAAGEGHLDAQDEGTRFAIARGLGAAISEQARAAQGRACRVQGVHGRRTGPRWRACKERGFTRIPSMPMTRRRLNFASFEEYMRLALSQKFRGAIAPELPALRRARPA